MPPKDDPHVDKELEQPCPVRQQKYVFNKVYKKTQQINRKHFLNQMEILELNIIVSKNERLLDGMNGRIEKSQWT